MRGGKDGSGWDEKSSLSGAQNEGRNGLTSTMRRGDSPRGGKGKEVMKTLKHAKERRMNGPWNDLTSTMRRGDSPRGGKGKEDLNNFDSDPEEFARTLCKDLDIRDAEVAVIRTLKECSSYLPEYPELALDALSRIYIFPAVAVAIREQLYEQKGSGIALDLVKLFGGKSSVIRKRKEWDLYEPIVDLLSNEEVETLDAREERNAQAMMAERGPISRWLVLRSSGS
ncbi:hypothetical protein Syun_031226 [Stephania yunnanensis]|uniref:Uncharacterized protein n=1 Tax=Stephania yunnanensis TaxID=152371 RepID=A0AAP0HGB0_9MAGN